MIAFDFEYYKPASVHEAVNLFFDLDAQNKAPVYYSGGTEIISLARVNINKTGAVIDIKGIPECNNIEDKNNQIIIGSTLSLSSIAEINIFIRRAADHTARNKITLGGNICGKLPYRETVLPFLLCNSEVLTAGRNGLRKAPINSVFNEKLNLENGEFLVQIITDKNYMDLPFKTVKRTKQEKVDYPLVSIAALKKDNDIRAAFSGLCGFPFRSSKIGEMLNDKNTDLNSRIDNIMKSLPAPVLNDIQGSREYRKFIAGNVLMDIIKQIGGVK